MLTLLLKHQWKSFWRSRDAGKNLAVRIFIGFATLYFLALSIGIGFFLVELINKFFPRQPVVKVFCGFILYYFLLDVLIRFVIQELPTLAVQPYLLHNIRRRQLIGFLNFSSLFTPLNLLPLFLFLPFTFSLVRITYGSLSAAGLAVSIIFLTITNHFLVAWLKRKTVLNAWWLLGFFLVTAAFVAGDYFRLFSLSKVSTEVFLNVLRLPALGVLTILMAVGAFINNYIFLDSNLYLEDFVTRGKRRRSANYNFLDRYGTEGELIAIDIKLITRNKRPRSVVLLSLIFVGYGFIFYKPEMISNNHWAFMIFGGVFLTGIFITNYGQFLFAWQSSHFDGLMAAHLPVRAYIKSKFMLLTAVSTLLFLMLSFYGFISWKLLIVQLAGYFFNIGIHAVIAVYFATRSYKGIDLSKKTVFNMQGMGASQWVYSLVILIVPLALYLPFSLIISPFAGVLSLGISGLVSFLLRDWWIDRFTIEFLKRKHEILEGFREK